MKSQECFTACHENRQQAVRCERRPCIAMVSRSLHRYFAILCALLLTLLLTGCVGTGSAGNGSNVSVAYNEVSVNANADAGSVGAGATSTPTSTPTLSPTPTKAPPTPKPTKATQPTPSTTGASNFQTYQGSGYTISYPVGWTVTPNSAQHDVNFYGPSAAIFTIQLSPMSLSPSQAMAKALSIMQKSKNYQKVNIAPSVTVNGLTWDQEAATFTASGTSLEMVFMAASHNGLVDLIYQSTTATFPSYNANVFQPMIQSISFS
jgi:hypothetical protein